MKNQMLYILILFGIASCYSQTYESEQAILERGAQNSRNEQLNIIQNEIGSNSFIRRVPTGNSVFIEQVGSGNVGNVTVRSDQSDINLLQVGNNNETFILLNASTVRQNVVQVGNDNLYRDVSIHGARLHTGTVVQEGSYNEIIRTGSNSLSERLQITQRGTGRQAFILHF